MESESKINNKQAKFFNKAKELAKKSDYCHKHGAVVVKKGKPIGEGFNKPKKTSSQANTEFKTIHAELSAILDTLQDHLHGCEIYVYREFSDGTPAMSKPCPCCQELLIKWGIKRVHYTTNGGYMTEKVA